MNIAPPNLESDPAQIFFMQTYGFYSTQVDLRTENGLDDTLLSPLDFKSRSGITYRAPVGTTTDGVSTPRFLWRIIPPNGDADFLPAVIHDAAYRNQLLIYCRVTGQYSRANLTQFQSDRLLAEALQANGVGVIKRNVIYYALRLFGARAFHADRLGIKI